MPLCLAAAAAPAAAQRRARLSADLAEQLARGDQDIDVIVARHAAREVDALARPLQPQGQTVPQERRGAAASTPVSSTRLQGDEAVTHLSSDAPVRSAADVTRETIGADQVWAGAGKLQGADRAPASAWR